MKTNPLALALSPQRHLYLDQGPLAEETLSDDLAEKVITLFQDGAIAGLLRLGVIDISGSLTPSFAFWQHYARLFVTRACMSTDIPVPSLEERQALVNQAPFMRGADYLDPELLEEIWQSLSTSLTSELQSFDNNLESYLAHYNPSWNQVGRICFHLAENKSNDDHPFAFLATYTSRLSHDEKLQHVPLKKALQEYSGQANNAALLKLLLPLQKAAALSPLIKELFESSDIFKPLLWTARQAHQFLQDIPLFESCGVMIRIPNWWNPSKPSRPQVAITIGNKEKKLLGMDSLVGFDLSFSLSNGEEITEEEWQELLSSTENFVKIKGQWVEVDKPKLQEVLAHWKTVQQQVKKNGLSFAQGLRLLAGTPESGQEEGKEDETIATWSHLNAGAWLDQTLQALRHPESSVGNDIQAILEKSLHATLRPYQQAGVQWLWLIYSLKLGGCLADDMGLGKTIQVLAVVLLIKHLDEKKSGILLILPASLLGNWQAEVARFTPELKTLIVHSSAGLLNKITPEALANIDIVITTYSVVHRVPLLSEIEWNLVVLDEAQMIKNPDAKQTKTVKALKSSVRLALTGTPIENRLGDLWSLFDFTSPGLLGSRKAFVQCGKKPSFCAAIRTLVSPYILRRLKSDRSIIQDLPDKTELRAFCGLSKLQAAMYLQSVEELEAKLEDIDNIARRGLVLSYLLRFKQICNHPTQWLGHGSYDEQSSGKFIRLKEICDQIAVQQEKVLIFTQFREIIAPLADFLAKTFGHEGLVLHGQTPIKQRQQLVHAFQQEQGPQFFILSLKAGGTGLNLTNASHVIHFDRWWNPAVENQATDRAYRIGQKKNVLVHKFVCKGTIEDKIDELIASKKALSQEILSGENEVAITELSNQDLIKIVSLDLAQVIES